MQSDYELIITRPDEKFKFLQIMDSRLKERNWTLKKLAEEMEMPVNTVYVFTSAAMERSSRFVAARIAQKLNIEEKEFRNERHFY